MRPGLASILISTLLVAACGEAPVPAPPRPSGPLCGLTPSPPTQVDHVVWILMENHSYPDIVGNAGEAPFINHTLVPGCGVATNHHNASHPSLPNYLALSAGTASGAGRSSDCNPADCPQAAPTIFSTLEAASRQWRVYAQSMPAPCDGQDAGDYTAHHNPAVYYRGLHCQQWDVDMGTPSAGSLVSDLASDHLPALSILVGDEAHDMHSGSIQAGDEWLATWILPITQTGAYRAGHTVVLITWDEGEGGDKSDGDDCSEKPTSAVSCWVPLIVLSASTPPGTRWTTPSNHYGVLRTTEELLGLSPLLGRAAGATSLRAAFHL